MKVKAEEFALYELNLMKAKHTKLDNIIYSKLEIQKYLQCKNITPDDARMVFSFRTRMAGFGENFRDSSGHKQCPLCHSHLDNQQMAFKCPETVNMTSKKGKYGYIFQTEIPVETIQNLRLITSDAHYLIVYPILSYITLLF